MSADLGRVLMSAGALLFVIGLAVFFKDKLPGLENIGKLPGDIAIERENFKFYFPVTTSILLSLALTLIFWLISKFRG